MSLSVEELNQIKEHVNSGGARMIRISNGDGGWAKFKDAIIVAVVLATGAVVWKQSNESAATTARLAALTETVRDLTAEVRLQRRP
jgi:hypothetical protein